MESKHGNIYRLLNKEIQYIIPVYQREYSWKAEVQCARLWKDIVNMVKQNRLHHFVGSIVSVCESNSLLGVQKQLIIDGQQRMTTLSLLMIALRDYLLEQGASEEMGKKITNKVLKNDAYDDEEAYKMLLTESDREIMIRLIDRLPVNEDEPSRIYANYKYFKQKVKEGILLPEEIHESIAKLEIVSIVLDKSQGDDPQLIFESLNSTGMDLSKSDLIRNYILMGLNNNEQKNIYNNYWRPFEKNFASKEDTDKMDRFFRNYLIMKKGTLVNFDNIYEEFKDYATNSEFSNQEELAKDILMYGDLYTNIISEEKRIPSSQHTLKNLFNEIRILRMEVAYPFLLKVYHDYIKETITIDEFVRILKLTISYVVRRAICGIATSSMNKTFATLKNEIDKNDYLNSLEAALYYLDAYKHFPDDKEFMEYLCKKDMYSLRIKNYIFVKLENEGNKETIPYEGYTIEHILPQNKNMRQEWKDALGENYEEIQAQYINNLGNLTLTRYNSEMGDKPFSEKLEVYKESAMHTLNKYVVQQTTWNKDTIEERANRLAECACKVWVCPTISDEVKAKYQKAEEPVQKVYDLTQYDFSNGLVEILYQKLHEAILQVEPKAKVEYKKLYIAYKLKTNFVDIVVQKSRLRLSINLDYDEVYDPSGICRDVTDLGRWGNGDVEIGFDSLSMLDSVIEIIKQAIEKQK